METETKCQNENTHNEAEEQRKASENGKKIFQRGCSNPALGKETLTISLREQEGIAQSKEIIQNYEKC